jgi:hypothetical protein
MLSVDSLHIPFEIHGISNVNEELNFKKIPTFCFSLQSTIILSFIFFISIIYSATINDYRLPYSIF